MKKEVKVLVAVTAATVIGTMGLLSKDREFAKVVQTSARNRKVPAEKTENCAFYCVGQKHRFLPKTSSIFNDFFQHF